MRIKQPLDQVDARGAFGPGAVFGKWSGTNWVRARIRTPIRRTRREQEVKRRLTVYSRAWMNLTAEQRQNWCEYSTTVTRYDSMGNPYHAGGMQEYIGASVLLDIAGLDPVYWAPTDQPPGELYYYEVEYDPIEGWPRFRLKVYWVPDQFNVQIWMSRPKPTGRKYYNNECVMSGQFQFPIPDEYRYVDRANQRYCFKFRAINYQGRAGPWWVVCSVAE